MLLAPRLLRRPTETRLNQHTTHRRLSNRRAITRDMPDGGSALGEGIRDPSARPRGSAGLPAPARPRAPRLVPRSGGTALAWPPSKAIRTQPGAARQPTPWPGCVQDCFEADPERCEGRRSPERLQEFKPSYRAGPQRAAEEAADLLRGSWPLATRSLRAALIEVCRLGWTLPV